MTGAALAALLGAASLLAAPARVSLSAAPAHVALAAGGRQVVRVTAPGGGRLQVEASVAGFALDLRGRPRIAGAGDAASFVSVSPRRLTVGRAGTQLVVSSRVPRRARPGDHSAVVLLSAVAPSARGLVVRMRIGLVVTVRVAGAVVHRVEVVRARVRRSGHRRLIELTLANRGNVVEPIGAGRLRVTLVRRGRVLAHLSPGPRRLLPGGRGLVGLRYAGRLRGAATARVELVQPGRRPVVRSFRLRL